MSDTSLAITFDPDASRDNTSERRFVHLEQVRESFDPNKTVTMLDIRQMIARAKSGVAASTYGFEDCPMTINDQTYKLWFDFYVWPSSMELDFTLDSTMCCISEPQIVTPLTEFSVIFDDTDAVELDFILTDLVGLPYWETLCCYKVDGTPVYGVTIKLEGTSTLVASEKIFGVARVRGHKMGAQHRLTTILIPHVPTPDVYEILMISGITLYNPDFSISLGATLRKQYWKLEFISSTEYKVTGNTFGTLDALGSTGVDYVCEYFTIPHEFLDRAYTPASVIRFSVQLSDGVGDNWGYSDIVSWDDPSGASYSINIGGYIGSYDFTNNPPRLGTKHVPQKWTLRFAGPETYSVIGETIPAIYPPGNINEDYVCDYFIIPKAMFMDGYSYDSDSRVEFTVVQAPLDPNINNTGVKISNLNVTITARWFDNGEEQTESLKMKIAQCVQDALDQCDGDGINNIIDPVPGEDFYVGYFSICDGDMIEVRKIKDKDD